MLPIDFVDSVNLQIGRYVTGSFEELIPEELGLDRRAGYRLYVDHERTCIAVPKSADPALQYYGGYEYVDKSCRQALGDWVFYFASEDEDSDDRVRRNLDYFSECSKENSETA